MITKDKLNEENLTIINYVIEHEDKSLSEISKELEITRSRINYLLYIRHDTSLYYKNNKHKRNTQIFKIRRKPGRKGYPEDFVQEVLSWLQNIGGDISRTAEHFNISNTVIYRWIKKYIPEKYQFLVHDKCGESVFTDDLVKRMYKDKEKGLSINEIAIKYKFSPNQIRAAISQYKTKLKYYSAGYKKGMEDGKKSVSSNSVNIESKAERLKNLFSEIIDQLLSETH